MNIQNALSDFMMAIDAAHMKGDHVLEITITESLFMDLLTELPGDIFTKQGDFFTGFQELPEWVKLSMSFGYVKVKRGLRE